MAPSADEAAVVSAIRGAGLTIYDSLDGHPHLFIGDVELEKILDRGLAGLRLDQPLRTRSKVLKTAVCRVLGYGAPESFRKTQPRFPGQNFDTYVQKADNLQIWNEEVAPDRRYALIRVNSDSVVVKVRVVTGTVIALLDPTGALTQKYQARARTSGESSRLVSRLDTPPVAQLLDGRRVANRPIALQRLLPIADVYEQLRSLLGTRLVDPGNDRERTRGDLLHLRVAELLGDDGTENRGQFPDVLGQLVEVKLQTAPTIDLGLVSPDSKESIRDFPALLHEDVRYAVFYGSRSRGKIDIEHVVVTTGRDFFGYFQPFEGLRVNKKLQIPLPRDFFL